MLAKADGCLIRMCLGQSVAGIIQKLNTTRHQYSGGYAAPFPPLKRGEFGWDEVAVHGT
jgi:hypothetical protein